MNKDLQERKRIIETACREVFDEVEETINTLRDSGIPTVNDSFEALHAKLLSLGPIESSLSALYARSITIRREVEKGRANSKANLEDSEIEVSSRSNFEDPMTSYTSRPQFEIKMRTLTINGHVDLRIWNNLYVDAQWLVEIVRTYQQEANRARRDIDTRIRIMGL